MKCIIFAAGRGTRMSVLTQNRPKCMLPVANKPIIEWTLENVKKAGIDKFIIISGWKDNVIESHFADKDFNIQYIKQTTPTGTADAIDMAKDYIDDNFIALAGDTIYDTEDIKNLLKSPNTLLHCETSKPELYGSIEVVDGFIKYIHEKSLRPPSDIVNISAYHFTPDVFKYTEAAMMNPQIGECAITDTINDMIESGYAIQTIPCRTWLHASYPWDLLDINKTLIKDHPQMTSDDGVAFYIYKSTIENEVNLEKSVKIGPYSHIRDGTSIGKDCKIGTGCEIKNSIIMDGTKIPHMTYIGDSIIGKNCNFGAGTKVANHRFDNLPIQVKIGKQLIDTERRKFGAIMGDNVGTGINSIINCGTVIPNDTKIFRSKGYDI